MTELKYLNKYLVKYKTNLLLGFLIIIIARILLLFTPGLIRESVNVIDEFRKGNIISIETVQTELIQNIFLILLAAIAAGIFTFLTRQTIINVSRYVEFDLKNEIYDQTQIIAQYNIDLDEIEFFCFRDVFYLLFIIRKIKLQLLP